MSVDVKELAWKLDTMFMLRRIMLNKTTNAAGLYMGQLPILAYICHNDGCTQKEISDWLNVRPHLSHFQRNACKRRVLSKRPLTRTICAANRLSVTESGQRNAFKCAKP